MGEFLDAADQLNKRDVLSESEGEAVEKVFEGISALQRVHSKADLEISNIESVFAAFEMAKTLGGFADYSPSDIEGLISSLRRVIVATIESSLEFPAYTSASSVGIVSPEDGTNVIEVSPPNPYLEFVRKIKNVRQEYSPKRTAAVLTFNYDLAIDYAFHYENESVDYGFSNQEVCEESISVLKLHGSLNWARGKDTGNIYPQRLGYFLNGEWNEYQRNAPFHLYIGSEIEDCRISGEEVEDEPVLVPPTWNKSEYQSQLQSVWSRASDELKEAEHIFCIGFSLNPTDSFFRYLYGLGTVGNRPLKNFYVVDPAVDQIEDRYRDMLGPAAERVFRPIEGTFEGALDVVEQEFG